MKGDLDYFAKGLYLRHYAADSFCEFCCAHSSTADPPGLWSNFRQDARWKQQLFTVPEWRALHPIRHWLFEAFGFLTHHNIECDELHILYLGVTQVALGSVLWVMAYRSMPETPHANVERIWSFVVDCYKDVGSSTEFTNLGLRSFTDPSSPHADYPVLRGRGAEIKDITEPVHRAWRHFRNPGTYEFARVDQMLEPLVAFQAILSTHSNDLFLPVSTAQRFREHVDDFLMAYSYLANKADEEGALLWSVRPKLHWLYHMAGKADKLNPRASACLIDEDYMGHIKKVVQTSVQGTPMERVPLKVAEKIRWAGHFAAIDC